MAAAATDGGLSALRGKEAAEDRPYLRIGSTEVSYLKVTPKQRLYDEREDFWDGNWVESAIELRAGGFQGRFSASLRAEDFTELRRQLAELHTHLEGEAKFSSMEGWLTIILRGDGLGHFEALCEAIDEPGVGNRLHFRLEFDQTEIPRMLKELEDIGRAFPVRGEPDT